MQCRESCGACCIALSISSPMPGLPNGKLAGEPCIHLDERLRCGLYHDPRRPLVCAKLRPALDICGNDRQEALQLLTLLEQLTTPTADA